jgi:hypothetical protein
MMQPIFFFSSQYAIKHYAPLRQAQDAAVGNELHSYAAPWLNDKAGFEPGTRPFWEKGI